MTSSNTYPEPKFLIKMDKTEKDTNLKRMDQSLKIIEAISK